MEKYFSGIYFLFLIYAVIGYSFVWFFAWFLARPFIGIVPRGNPYPNVYTCWMIPLGVHTLIVLVLCGFTARELGLAERGTLEIFLYCIGFLVLLIINSVIIQQFHLTKKNIQFRS